VLEAVEVDEEHRELLLLPPGDGQRLAQPVVTELPVRQARQRVEVRLVEQLLLALGGRDGDGNAIRELA
jgi:hypothetical protein